MIVVEGCDGTGKTSLVEDICHEFGLAVGERGTSDRDKLYEVTFNDTMRALSEAILSPGYPDHLTQSSKPLVWDRLFFSDFVYAPIQHRPVAFNQASKYFIVAVMEALRCPIIYCRPPDSIIHANVEDEESHQMEGVRENTQLIIDEYHRIFTLDKGKLNVVTYDYTTPGDRYLVFGVIANYLQDRKEQRRGNI